MSDPQPDKNSDKIPRGAIAVVIVGVFLTLAVIGIDLRGGTSAARIDWQTVEDVPVSKPTADGDARLNRTTLAALPPNDIGELIFRVSGVVVIDSDGKRPTEVKCTASATDPDSSVARTPNLRAAWPRPSEELQLQEVPEALVLKFNAIGNRFLEVPVRDSIRTYTNSASPTLVEWGEFDEENQQAQEWTWTMDKGTGPGAATLGYAAVFKTAVKPKATIDCRADAGGRKSRAKLEVAQREWPIEAGETVPVETDPELDVE